MKRNLTSLKIATVLASWTCAISAVSRSAILWEHAKDVEVIKKRGPAPRVLSKAAQILADHTKKAPTSSNTTKTKRSPKSGAAQILEEHTKTRRTPSSSNQTQTPQINKKSSQPQKQTYIRRSPKDRMLEERSQQLRAPEKLKPARSQTEKKRTAPKKSAPTHKQLATTPKRSIRQGVTRTTKAKIVAEHDSQVKKQKAAPRKLKKEHDPVPAAVLASIAGTCLELSKIVGDPDNENKVEQGVCTFIAGIFNTAAQTMKSPRVRYSNKDIINMLSHLDKPAKQRIYSLIKSKSIELEDAIKNI